MRSRLHLGAALLAGVLLLGGCATSPRFDRSFGQAARAAVAAQVANPAAAANQDPVQGSDGKSARAAYQRYQGSFATPAAGALSDAPIGAK